jgi:hypothetical protein
MCEIGSVRKRRRRRSVREADLNIQRRLLAHVSVPTQENVQDANLPSNCASQQSLPRIRAIMARLEKLKSGCVMKFDRLGASGERTRKNALIEFLLIA